jgi:xylulokinase
MELLGIDCGSSSVMAGVLRGDRVVGEAVRVRFPTRHQGSRVEVDAGAFLKAFRDAVRLLGARAKGVDAISLAVMSPAWVAMDARGEALTPLVTHQDRRSVAEAEALEARVGKARHLRLAGNRPVPGGISSTTWAWYLRHEPARVRKADLVGHLNTFLHRRMTGARVTDPSNASFMGLYRTTDLGGWSGELCEAVGVRPSQLPEVIDGDRIAGRITAAAARAFRLTEGTPMLTGIVDGSAGMLLAGARVGQLFNVIGSTDVLALCTDNPVPHERLLTRGLGIGRRWLSVSTIAAAASPLYWAKVQFFPDWTLAQFRRAMSRLATRGAEAAGGVRFDPYLAGDRTSVEQRRGAFTGLTLAATREQMLAAIIESLAAASAARLELLDSGKVKVLRSVVVSGGAEDRLDRLMHRDWPGRWTFRPITEATLRGLGVMEPKEG